MEKDEKMEVQSQSALGVIPKEGLGIIPALHSVLTSCPSTLLLLPSALLGDPLHTTSAEWQQF